LSGSGEEREERKGGHGVLARVAPVARRSDEEEGEIFPACDTYYPI
jgi:hypothetical protein